MRGDLISRVVELEVIDRDDDVSQVALVGRLDVQGMQAVDVRFHGYVAARRRPAIVDLSRLEFIASLGIGMLISCAQSLQRHGASMVLLAPSGIVAMNLETAGIDRAIPVARDLNEALRLLGRA